LASKLNPAGVEPARPEQVEHGQGHLGNVVGKLVGVPPVLRIAAVDVDRAEDAESRRGGDLVLEAAPRQRGVVGLDVDLDLGFKAVALEEAVHVAASRSYWCLVGSCGLGSMRMVPAKPSLCLCSTTIDMKRPSWSISRARSVLRMVS
jgi:hypothetical protein